MTSVVGTVAGAVAGVEVGTVDGAVVKVVDVAVATGLLETMMWLSLLPQAHSDIISKRTMMMDNVLFIVIMELSFCYAMRCAGNGLSIKREHLPQQWLRTGDGVFFHNENIRHKSIPTFYNGAFVLGLCCKIHTLAAFVITEQLITHIPDGIIADSGFPEHLFQ